MTNFIGTNNAQTTLAAAAASGDTTLSLASAANFPSSIPDGYVLPLTLNDAATRSIFEIVYVTAITGTSVTVMRGQEGTAAQNWSVGDIAYSASTAGYEQALAYGNGQTYAADTGVVNAYAVALTPALTAHVVGMPIRVKWAHSNTGASTFNPGPGAVAVQRLGLALQPNDIVGGNIGTVIYDGAVYQLTDPTPVIARGALLALSATQSIPNGVETAITWPAATYDTDGCATSSGFTVPAGVLKVRLTGQATFAANATGSRKMRALQNGTLEGTGLFASRVGTADGADVTVLNGAGAVVNVSAGDTIQLMVTQTSGAALNLINPNTWFAMEILR